MPFDETGTALLFDVAPHGRELHGFVTLPRATITDLLSQSPPDN